MSLSDLAYSQAISQGNSLRQETREHNESIRQNNQMLVQAWNSQKARDDSKSQEDKLMIGAKDSYTGFEAVGHFAQGYNRVKNTGLVGAFKEDAQAISDKLSSIKNTVSQKATQLGQKISAPLTSKVAVSTPEFTATAPSNIQPKASVQATENITDKVASKTSSAVDEGETLTGKISKGIETAGKVGKIAGVIGGGIAITQGIKDLADGTFKKESTTEKVASGLKDVGGLLDVASVFLPVLAPLGAITSVAGATIDTVDTIDKDKKQKSDDSNLENKQLAENRSGIQEVGQIQTTSGRIQPQTTYGGSSAF
tara:strand:+ start:1125 stop:2057 length:933 start_codon:yes stop_codon:yes gene_type:complete